MNLKDCAKKVVAEVVKCVQQEPMYKALKKHEEETQFMKKKKEA